MQDNNLIFIISQPRSGSTLLQKILSNNKQVATASEPWFLLPFIGYDQRAVTRGIYDTPTASIAFRDLEQVTGEDFLIKDYVKEMILKIYGRLKGEQADYFLDKTPRYYEILPQIREWFPNAKIIILKRNPLDVLNSIVHTWGIYSLMDLLFFKRDILHSPFILEEFLKNSIDDELTKSISYEELTQDTSNSIKALYNWIGIDYKPEFLDFSKNRKLRGSLGDPHIKRFTNVMPAQGKNITNNKLFKKFIQGYSEYLSKDFLKVYGNYQNIDGEKTSIFEYFLYLSKYMNNGFAGYKMTNYYKYKLLFGDPRKKVFKP